MPCYKVMLKLVDEAEFEGELKRDKKLWPESTTLQASGAKTKQ